MRFFSGHYFDFYDDQLKFLTKCAETYGEIVYLRFFHIAIYILNSPYLIEETLANCELKKSKTIRTPLQKILFGNGLLASEGDFWLKQRRMLQKVFDQKHLSRYAETITQTAEEYFNQWQEGDKKNCRR